MDLGVTMLARLGGRHFNYLAGTTLYDHMTILTQRGALGRVRLGGARISPLEIRFIGHGLPTGEKYYR